MKKILTIILVIIITVLCIISGIHTRYDKGIIVTQISTNSNESLSYMIETNKNNIIMIDGGNFDDSEHLKEILMKKGGIVDRWFITIANPENFGAMQKIIEDGNIQINNIYISFNTADWYDNNEHDRYKEVANFLDLIYSENIIKKVYDVPFKYEFLVDNLYFTILNVKNPEFNSEYAGFNQSMVIKVNNTYKSMIFMGNIANEAAKKMKDNNLDEINTDAVQVSNNNQQNVDDDIYIKMSPKYIFMPVPKENNKDIKINYINKLKETLKIEESYVSCDGDFTLKIW